MAAGLGSRFGGDKPWHPVGTKGESLLEYTLFDAKRAGFDKAVIILRESSLKKFDELRKRSQQFPELDFSIQPTPASLGFQREKPLGTGHALLAAKEKISGAFGVVNGDDFYGAETFQRLTHCLRDNENCLLGFRLGNTLSPFGGVNRGLCKADSLGYLSQIEEVLEIKKTGNEISGRLVDHREIQLQASNLVSMNCWGFQSTFFDTLALAFEGFIAKLNDNDQTSEFFLPHVAAQLPPHSIKLVESREKWMGLTFGEDLHWVKKALVKLVENGYYASPLLSNASC